MATKRPAKPRQTLVQEAANSATDPERLRGLARHREIAVHRAAWRNPSLPEEVWRTALLKGEPEAWANPMAPFYLLTWTPQKEDGRNTIEKGTFDAASELWRNPERCSPEGKILLTAKLQEAWFTSSSAINMMLVLGAWASKKGDRSLEHREVVRLFTVCLRTHPLLTSNDRQALSLLEAWSQGGEDQRKEAHQLTNSIAIKHAVAFALNPHESAWFPIDEVLMAVSYSKENTPYGKSKAEHDSLLADLIRREMPSPPVVE